MIVDTHTHLYLPEFANDETSAVERAIDAGVGHLIFPNVDFTTVSPMKELHSRFPANTSMAMGLHPTEVGENYAETLELIVKELESNRQDYKAVGEIGIDLYWDRTYEREQRDVFARQIEMATRHDLPVIIHCREGLDVALDVLKSVERTPRGVFHSFGGNENDVARIRSVGDFYFGINGIVTFKNCRLREVLPIIGLDRILLETDAPYLAPVPFRGKRNESAYIVETARYVADVLGVGLDELEAVTTHNACDLFRLDL